MPVFEGLLTEFSIYFTRFVGKDKKSQQEIFDVLTKKTLYYTGWAFKVNKVNRFLRYYILLLDHFFIFMIITLYN